MKLFSVLALLFFSIVSLAQDEVAANDSAQALSQEQIQYYLDSVNASFKYQTGEIKLDGGFAKINVPKGLKFLDAAQSKTVLQDFWGNPEDNSILGMLLPEKYTPLDSACWAFTVSFDDMGFVEDDDADDIDYAELLETMKKEIADGNADRQKEGYNPVQLIGWASSPFYDKERKVLHWAKELKFGEAEHNTLNYDVRVLGRKGVLSLNAVGAMACLPEVKPTINYLLSSVKFTEGNQYTDYNSSTDKIAAYTVGGLVAGKVLAKVGFLAIILKYIKLIVIAVGAAFTGIWKWISGRKKKADENVNNNDVTNV